MTDSHIHLTYHSFDGTFSYIDLENGVLVRKQNGTREKLIERMKESGIGFCIEPAIDLDSNRDVLALAEKMPGFVYPAVGLHPTRTYQSLSADSSGNVRPERVKLNAFRKIRKYAKNPLVIAIGETGLDYHCAKKDQHRVIQKIWFVRQLRLADKLALPVIYHIREADRDALKILRRFRGRLHGGVYHCFHGDAETAKIYTGLGLAIGIGGMILQNPEKCREIDDAVRQTPIENILIETDGPFVLPDFECASKKQRQKTRNTSMILPGVAQRIAEIKGMTREEVEKITAENAARIFGIVSDREREIISAGWKE